MRLPTLLLVALAISAHAENWPGFRGGGLGYTDGRELPLTWSAKTGENIAWRAPLPKSDNAWSSPVVWGDRVFVTCATNQPVTHRVLCLAKADGKLLWETPVEPGPLILKDLRGGYGAPTPCTDGQRVYAVFGSAVIAALDFDGKLVWRKTLANTAFDVALGSSPVLFGQTVILDCDQTGKTSSIMAFDKTTGEIRWDAKRPDASFTHTTPVLVKVAGQPQMLVSASSAIQGVDPASGKILWWCGSPGDASSPAFGDGLVFSDSGRGGKAVCVDPTGAGDVTKTHLKWTYPQIPEGLSSAIIAGGLVWRTHSPEIVKCLKLATGELVFSERLPGVSTWASPFATDDGRIYFASAGKSYVLKAGEKLAVLAVNEIGEENRASAAVSDGQIFLRGDKNLYCIQKKMKTLVAFAALISSAFAGDWVNISDPITAQVKPGYAGPTAGVIVDRASGEVFMVVNDQGLWRSGDHGATFARCDEKNIGGRCETGWALQADPGGKRLACFMIYGDSGFTSDRGATWTKWKTSHLDFGAVDWADTGKRLLAMRHESGGLLTTSEDGGATWTNLEKGFSGCGVFDRATFVATKEKEQGIFRSTDAGATWTQVFPETPSAAVPVVFENAGYWPTGKGVLVSRDKGATWAALGTPVEATHGPFFDTAQHFVVVGKSGFSETKDGGHTWQLAAPLPAGFDVNRVGPHFAWDQRADIFYSSKMTKPTFKFDRSK